MAFGVSRYKLVHALLVLSFIVLLWHSYSLATLRSELQSLSLSVQVLARVADRSTTPGSTTSPWLSTIAPVSKATIADRPLNMNRNMNISYSPLRAGFECAPLLLNVSDAFKNATSFMQKNAPLVVSPEAFESASCDAIRAGLGVHHSYVTQPGLELDDEERKFEIAYSIVMFKDFYQTERLIRALYRPNHLFCIHVDAHANDSVYRAAKKLSTCFQNIFTSSKRVTVRWGKFSVLEADLTCMRELYERSSTWKYWINLTGQEYPLKTNAELVKVLRALNGGNAMEATVKRIPTHVWQRPYIIELQALGVTPTKGAVHVVVTRAFVEFLQRDATTQRILEIVRDNVTFPAPAEMFFSTINFNPQLGAPGAFKGPRETHPDTFPFINRLKNWNVWPFKYPCASGKWVHNLCIWGVRDLPFVTHAARKELFLNKLHLEFEPLTLDCLENWLWQRTNAQIAHGTVFDDSYYRSLRIANFHV